MNTHCTTDELLALRDGDAVSGVQSHLAECELCQEELLALDQRVAALRALPTRRPPRDRWPIVRAQLERDRRRSRLTRGGWAAVAVAAGLTLAVGLRDFRPTGSEEPRAAVTRDDTTELAFLVQESQQLEAALTSYRPDGRVVSGRAASLIAELEDRISAVDAGILEVKANPAQRDQLVGLWRNRVDLMGALVNAHVTRAAYVGF